MFEKHVQQSGMLLVALIISAGGCTQQKPSVSSSTTEATVHGTVRINGELATAGEVVFDPANYLRKMEPSRTAPIGEDGTYTIRTLVGENRVRLGGDQIPLERGLAYEDLLFEVKAGDNTLDIAFPRTSD